MALKQDGLKDLSPRSLGILQRREAINEDAMATPAKLDHFTLLVGSFAASMPYYDVLLPLLGFTKRDAQVWQHADGLYLQFGEARAETRPYERYGAGMNHVGFGVGDPEAVEKIRSAMSNAGFAVPEIQDHGGVRALFLKDPDGIRFEVSYCPPGTTVV
jgi:catechol-2,3-dioxygenase